MSTKWRRVKSNGIKISPKFEEALKEISIDDLSRGFGNKGIATIMETLMKIFDEVYGDKKDTCQKGLSGCYCKTGYAYDDMCPDCRDDRHPSDIYSYCVCPPDEEE